MPRRCGAPIKILLARPEAEIRCVGHASKLHKLSQAQYREDYFSENEPGEFRFHSLQASSSSRLQQVFGILRAAPSRSRSSMWVFQFSVTHLLHIRPIYEPYRNFHTTLIWCRQMVRLSLRTAMLIDMNIVLSS